MDARDPLLPFEGVCHQLGIISYHPSICSPPPVCANTPAHPDQDQDTKAPAVRVQLVSLNSTRETAAPEIQHAQQKYKRQYDKRATYTTTPLKTGNWVLVCFPQDVTDAVRKLSRPWHGPYWVISLYSPNVSVTKVYFPQDRPICVHKSRVKPCHENFPADFYWYGRKRRGSGQPPKWVSAVLDAMDSTVTVSSSLPGNDGDDQSQTSHLPTLSAADNQSRTLPSSLIQPSDSTAAHTSKSKYPLRNHRQRSGRPSGGAGVM